AAARSSRFTAPRASLAERWLSRGSASSCGMRSSTARLAGSHCSTEKWSRSAPSSCATGGSRPWTTSATPPPSPASTARPAAAHDLRGHRMRPMADLPETAAWRLLEAHDGFEVLFPRRAADGYRFDGHSVGVEGGESWSIHYTLELDSGWRTRSA